MTIKSEDLQEDSKISIFGRYGINVIALLLGVLIARIVVVWVDVLEYYVDWKVSTNSIESQRDRIQFHLRWKSALLSSVLIILVVIIIYVWYTKELRDIKLKAYHHEVEK